MTFNISFTNETERDGNRVGAITLGEFSERLIIPLSRWQEHQYETQWVQALRKIIEQDDTTTVLITEIYPDNSAEYVNLWPVYRQGTDVYIQNRLLFLDVLPHFDEDSVNEYIGKRETVDSEGNEISEWKVDIDSIRLWLETGIAGATSE